jgi:MFS family permease
MSPEPEPSTTEERALRSSAKRAVSLATRFVVLLGLVSLFADMTYEGARGVAGPYLGMLGASAFVVSLVAGLGELAGYALRLVSGRFSDKTGRYWPITIFGYVVNLLSVPALALTGTWQSAAGLLIAERVGKAIRNPPRDAMLSHASHEIGRGWGFGLHEAMDQTGALIGPLVVAAILARGGGYRTGFAFLLIPALVSLVLLFGARRQFPHPRELEIGVAHVEATGISRRFWTYAIGAGLIAAGYADFPLIAFHFAHNSLITPASIPLTYALAMGVSAVSALVFGKLFDRVGLASSAVGIAAAAGFAPLVFLGNSRMALVGMALWGVGLGVQESALRACLGHLVSVDRRGSAYGIFDTTFGVFWAAGSAIMGLLYSHSLIALVTFSVVLQLASLPLLLSAGRGQSAE